MASWQAHLAVWIVRWRVKRRLRGAPDYRWARKILMPERYTVPAAAHISAAQAGGVPGEWVKADSVPKGILLYFHGGGYFACSAETHRAITVSYALRGFRVFAANYRLAPENQFPAAVDDAVAAYRGLLARKIFIRAKLFSGAIPRVAGLRFLFWSRSGMRRFLFPREQPSFLRGPISRPRANPSAQTRAAAPCFMARTLLPARAII